MRGRIARLVGWTAGLLLALIVLVLAVRVYDAVTGPPLAPWHTHVPDEPGRAEIDAMDWAAWITAEDAIFADVRVNVTDALPTEYRLPENRYFADSPIYPGRFQQDWNRSYVLTPDGPPVGAAVLLHGLTDAPFSLRHVARHYRERGFAAVVVRMPGHGTVPAGLTAVGWPDWAAATRLAVREARRRAPDGPLHLVGYSNGGALAMDFALDALEDGALARPDRIVLISPMIGITRFARVAGVAAWPAVFPAFVRAAWFDTIPEFNPFKYNSFPVNAARQSHLLTAALQGRLDRMARAGGLERLAPVLTFQSAVDFTVSMPAVVTALYGRLPANGSELVLFDINRAATLGPLFRPAAETVLERVLPSPPRAFRTTVVSNAAPRSYRAAATVLEAGATEPETRALDTTYPRDIYSLSHVALPFPASDGLYGGTPDPRDDFGVTLGNLSTRGELGVLVWGPDQFARLTFNPFFVDMIGRIDAAIEESLR